jgi:holo-[acyl-carrier protein] synthase
MIKGIGIDLVDIKRIEEIESDRFIDRILSEEEKKQYHNIANDKIKLTYLSGRYAAKEALFKAIQSGPGNTYYKDFSILNRENGSPYVLTEFFKDNEVIHMTITHTDTHAIACAIIEVL